MEFCSNWFQLLCFVICYASSIQRCPSFRLFTDFLLRCWISGGRASIQYPSNSLRPFLYEKKCRLQNCDYLIGHERLLSSLLTAVMSDYGRVHSAAQQNFFVAKFADNLSSEFIEKVDSRQLEWRTALIVMFAHGG